MWGAVHDIGEGMQTFHPLRLFLPLWPPVTPGKGTQTVCDSVSVLPQKEERTVGHGLFRVPGVEPIALMQYVFPSSRNGGSGL